MAYRYRGEARQHVMRELFVVRKREMIVPRPCFHAYTEFRQRRTGKNAIVFGTLGTLGSNIR
jgi:hypothetical protein